MTVEPTAVDPKISKANYNIDMKRAALMKKAAKAHDWRTQVWAQCELRLRAINAELQVLGVEPFEPYETDFTDESMLHHYSEMTLG